MLGHIYRHDHFDPKLFVNKKLISFDSDGTIQLTKSKIDTEMARLLNQLAKKYKVNIISGTNMDYLKPNVIDQLEKNENITLSPTCGTRLVALKNGEYRLLYEELLKPEEIQNIISAFSYALEKAGHHPPQVWGEMIEDRGSQVTFSALGQRAPTDAKIAYDPDLKKRMKIAAFLREKISDADYDIKIAGGTSVDVTRKGINKGYGMKKLAEYYSYSLNDILFIGDRLDEIGNDYPAAEAGVDCIWVDGQEDTKKVLRHILATDR
ncbi:MAG: HAD-IIB family hydrolase [Candidatus Roizmanbacteria bacterium]